MPNFINPFSGLTPERKLSLSETIRVLRLDVAAEEEAVHLYTAHAEAIDEPLAKKILESIANEEIVHIGEFQSLIDKLSAQEHAFMTLGAEEVEKMTHSLKKLGASYGK